MGEPSIPPAAVFCGKAAIPATFTPRETGSVEADAKSRSGAKGSNWNKMLRPCGWH